MKKLIALALAAIMPFSNPIVGGNDTLIREKITSENYVAGVSGWSINRDGNAEFNNVTTRGELIIGDYPNGVHAIGGGVDTPNGWAFYSVNDEEVGPAELEAIDQGTESSLILRSPDLGNSLATISLTSLQAAFSQRARLQFTANKITLGTYGAAGDRIDVNQDVTRNDQAWSNITLQNSWVTDSGSTTPQYMKDANGNVHVRGAVKNGTTVVIGTLPAGFRPQGQVWFTPALHSGTSTAASHIQVGTDGVLTITTNLATAQTRLRLGFSFPTFN